MKGYDLDEAGSHLNKIGDLGKILDKDDPEENIKWGRIERELRLATNYFKEGKSRQIELIKIASMADKLPHSKFDKFSDETAEWLNSAITAINSKKFIEDFN